MEIKTRIPIEKIIKVSNIRNENEEIEDLKASIEIHGLLQPIIVSESTTGYKIVAGHRRYLACKMLGHETIPAVVQKFKNPQLIQITENVQRKNLSRVEESKVIYDLKNKLNCNINTLCRHLGKDSNWMKKRISFHSVREFLIDSETLPASSIKMLTFDIALKMAKHNKSFWLKMAAESLGKRWYPEELEENFKSIVDPNYVIKPKNSNSFQKKIEPKFKDDFGDFTIEKDNQNCEIRLIFINKSEYFRMLDVLTSCGGELDIQINKEIVEVN